MVGSRVDNDVVFVTPLRHDPSCGISPQGAAWECDRCPTPTSGPGQTGLWYRHGLSRPAGHDGLEVFTLLTLGDGGQNRYWTEAFAPIVKQRNAVLIVGSITLLLVVAGALIVARSISNPIIVLTRAVRVMAGGNLQQAVPIVRHDEIGELSQAFNTMTADLAWSRMPPWSRESRSARPNSRRRMLRSAPSSQRLTADNLRMRAELDLVRQMQQLVLPAPDELAAIDGLDIAAFMEPADESRRRLLRCPAHGWRRHHRHWRCHRPWPRERHFDGHDASRRAHASGNAGGRSGPVLRHPQPHAAITTYSACALTKT